MLKIYMLFYYFCSRTSFANCLLKCANVCVSPVCFLLVCLYVVFVVFVWRAGAWGIVCVLVACPCVSSVGACTKGCVGLLCRRKHGKTLSYTQYDDEVHF
jgi:hypothetical protein